MYISFWLHKSKVRCKCKSPLSYPNVEHDYPTSQRLIQLGQTSRWHILQNQISNFITLQVLQSNAFQQDDDQDQSSPTDYHKHERLVSLGLAIHWSSLSFYFIFPSRTEEEAAWLFCKKICPSWGNFTFLFKLSLT